MRTNPELLLRGIDAQVPAIQTAGVVRSRVHHVRRDRLLASNKNPIARREKNKKTMAIYEKGEAVLRDGKPNAQVKAHKNVAALLIAALVILLLATAGFFYAVEKTAGYLSSQFSTDAQVQSHLE